MTCYSREGKAAVRHSWCWQGEKRREEKRREAVATLDVTCCFLYLGKKGLKHKLSIDVTGIGGG